MSSSGYKFHRLSSDDYERIRFFRPHRAKSETGVTHAAKKERLRFARELDEINEFIRDFSHNLRKDIFSSFRIANCILEALSECLPENMLVHFSKPLPVFLKGFFLDHYAFKTDDLFHSSYDTFLKRMMVINQSTGFRDIREARDGHEYFGFFIEQMGESLHYGEELNDYINKLLDTGRF